MGRWRLRAGLRSLTSPTTSELVLSIEVGHYVAPAPSRLAGRREVHRWAQETCFRPPLQQLILSVRANKPGVIIPWWPLR